MKTDVAEITGMKTLNHDYSCNENTMRGAAKSLATPPAAFAMNVIRMIEVVYASIL